MASVYPAVLAVLDSTTRRWAAIVPSLDVASDGRTADEAMDNALEAAEEARSVKPDAVFEVMTVEQLAEFLRDAGTVNGALCVAARMSFA